MIEEVDDETKAAVVKAARVGDLNDAHQRMFVEVAVSVLQFVDEADLDELSDEEVAEILETVEVERNGVL